VGIFGSSSSLASAGVLRQQLNKFYGSRRCVSKIALELIRRPSAAQSAEPSRDRALMRNAGVEKSEKSRDIRNRAVHDAHLLQRKPLAKSRSEKRPPLNVETARNSLSQWLTSATAVIWFEIKTMSAACHTADSRDG
jgi:hypothetical protein